MVLLCARDTIGSYCIVEFVSVVEAFRYAIFVYMIEASKSKVDMINIHTILMTFTILCVIQLLGMWSSFSFIN